jgi:hypothetical protein
MTGLFEMSRDRILCKVGRIEKVEVLSGEE